MLLKCDDLCQREKKRITIPGAVVYSDMSRDTGTKEERIRRVMTHTKRHLSTAPDICNIKKKINIFLIPSHRLEKSFL